MLSLVRILGEDLKSLLVNNHQHVITNFLEYLPESQLDYWGGKLMES